MDLSFLWNNSSLKNRKIRFEFPRSLTSSGLNPAEKGRWTTIQVRAKTLVGLNHKTASSLLVVAALVLLILPSALAYYPPTDTAGPLHVRIYEPTMGVYGAGGLVPLNRTGVPFTISVSLQNSGETELRGSLRLTVIDDWQVEPSSPVPFAVRGKGSGRFQFTVTVGEGTVNADYPIHAYAEFEHLGRRFVAHPILLLTTELSNPPRARLPVEWEPIPVPSDGAMGLWRLAVRRESAVIEKRELLASDRGGRVSEGAGAIRYGEPVDRGDIREAISVTLGPRPPSFREAFSLVRVEYPLLLPQEGPIRFISGLAGSARFRVLVRPFDESSADSVVLLDRDVGSEKWENVEIDLDRFAGQAIRLQLEAESSLLGSSTAFFGEPSITAGSPREPLEFPPADGREFRELGVVLQSGERYEVRLWPGRRGLLDSTLGFNGDGLDLKFNGFHVRVLGDSLDDWRSAQEMVAVEARMEEGRYQVRHSFRGWAGSFDLLGEVWANENAFQARFWLENLPPERPWLAIYLEEVSLGPWSDDVSRVFAGVGNVIENPGKFSISFGGHRLASSFVGFEFENGISLVQAVDTSPDRLQVDPGRNIYTLNTPHTQTLTIIPSPEVWEAAFSWRDLANLKAGGGVPDLAGRFVFDLWSWSLGYGRGARELQRSFKYGLTDAAVVWHNWQRWGYDYRLPDVYPPNPQGGSEEEFAQLVSLCRDHDVLFAPHDNYIDFYPDAEGFSFDKIVFNADGTPQKAWYRSSLLAQSYRFRPDCVRPFLERNLRLIKEGLNPNSYFIDVWSSKGPHDFWTRDGRFIDRKVTRREWGESFAWIRDFLGDKAPQISEAGHDQLIGWLDGAQTNHLRVGQPPGGGFVIAAGHSDTERIPWLDAVVHDVFILHGAGYPGRYEAGLDSGLHGIYSDDYITTEVLTGHPAMVPAPFGRDVVRKYWFLQGIMRALALRRIEEVEFVDDNIHRQRVKWDNGSEIWVNRGEAEWQIDQHLLPQYGFLAQVPSKRGLFEAGIVRRDGVIVEFARGPDTIYASARPVVMERDSQSGRPSDGPDLRPTRMNPEGKVISFGPVATNGGARLVQQKDGLMIIPLPDSPYFVFSVNWAALPWRLTEPERLEAVNEDERVLWSVPITLKEGWVRLNCEPGIFAYQLR